MADVLSVRRNTAHRIVWRYKKREKRMTGDEGGNQPQLVDDDIIQSIVEIVENNPSITLRNINSKLRQQAPQKSRISDSTIRRVLDGQLITLEKLADCQA